VRVVLGEFTSVHHVLDRDLEVPAQEEQRIVLPITEFVDDTIPLLARDVSDLEERLCKASR
jgi:hypothetical protein